MRQFITAGVIITILTNAIIFPLTFTIDIIEPSDSIQEEVPCGSDAEKIIICTPHFVKKYFTVEHKEFWIEIDLSEQEIGRAHV